MYIWTIVISITLLVSVKISEIVAFRNPYHLKNYPSLEACTAECWDGCRGDLLPPAIKYVYRRGRCLYSYSFYVKPERLDTYVCYCEERDYGKTLTIMLYAKTEHVTWVTRPQTTKQEPTTLQSSPTTELTTLPTTELTTLPTTISTEKPWTRYFPNLVWEKKKQYRDVTDVSLSWPK